MERSKPKILSGVELMTKGNEKTLPKRGPKETKDSDFHLQNYYEQLKEVLSEDRVQRIGDLSKAVYHAEEKKIELLKDKGKFWQVMGYSLNSKKYLYPEEALMLLETCHLELYYGSIPLSIQEAYGLLLNNEDCNLSQYQAYAHLSRMGYIAVRHRGKSDSIPYQRKIRLDQHISTNHDQNPTDEGKEMDVNADLSTLIELRDDKEVDRKNSGSDKRHKLDPEMVQLNDVITISEPSHSTSNNGHSSPLRNQSVSRVWFPNCAGTTRMSFAAPSPELLPENVVVTDSMCQINIEKILNATKPRRHERYSPHNYRRKFPAHRDDRSRSQQNDYPKIFPHCKSNARSWAEFKEDMWKYCNERNSWHKSAAAHLQDGRGICQGLAKPSDATSYAALLRKLQVIKPLPAPTKHELSRVPISTKELKVAYDIHLPSQKYKKTGTALPNHYLVIADAQDDPPNLSLLRALKENLDDLVPIHFAVVDGGDVAFYSFNNVEVPALYRI